MDPFKFWLEDSNELTLFSRTVEGFPRPLNIPPVNLGIMPGFAPAFSSSVGKLKLLPKERPKLVLKTGASIYRLFEFTDG